jgi:hypothetical protein
MGTPVCLTGADVTSADILLADDTTTLNCADLGVPQKFVATMPVNTL